MELANAKNHMAIASAREELRSLKKNLEKIFGREQIQRLKDLASLCDVTAKRLFEHLRKIEEQIEAASQGRGDVPRISRDFLKNECPEFKSWVFCYEAVSTIFPIFAKNGQMKSSGSTSFETLAHPPFYKLVSISKSFLEDVIKMAKVMGKENGISSEALDNKDILDKCLQENKCGLGYLEDCSEKTKKFFADCKQVMNRNLLKMQEARKEKEQNLPPNPPAPLGSLDKGTIESRVKVCAKIKHVFDEESFSGDDQLPTANQVAPTFPGAPPMVSQLQIDKPLEDPTRPQSNPQLSKTIDPSFANIHRQEDISKQDESTTFNITSETQAPDKYKIANDSIQKHFTEFYKSELTKSYKLKKHEFYVKWKIYCEIFKETRDDLRRRLDPSIRLDLVEVAEKSMNAFLEEEERSEGNEVSSREELCKKFASLFIGLL